MGTVRPSLVTSAAWFANSTARPSRRTRATGSSSGWPVCSLTMRNTHWIGWPAASSAFQPVSDSATGLTKVIRPVGIGGDHRIADAGERHPQPLALLAELPVGLVPVNRHFDLRGQLSFLERFEDVSERPGELGAGQRGGVAVGRQIDHRHVVLAADRFRGFDAVHRAFQPDVHQHQLRPEPAGQGDGLLALRGDPGDLVAEPPQLAGQVRGDDGFVFNDENGGHAEK